MTHDTTDTTHTTASGRATEPAPGDDAPTAADGVEHGELIGPDGDGAGMEEHESPTEAIAEPAKVMRIGSMVKQLLEEVRQAPLDEASRERLAEIYERSVVEITEALSPDLQEELRMLAIPFDRDAVPSDAELRIAKAQLVGWLEGLFHGIQASLMAQQMAARQQLAQMRQLNAGGAEPRPPDAADGAEFVTHERPGTYL
jgi:Bacterial proteasome activator